MHWRHGIVKYHNHKTIILQQLTIRNILINKPTVSNVCPCCPVFLIVGDIILSSRINNMDRAPKVVPVYTGHPSINTIKRIKLLFIAYSLLHRNPSNTPFIRSKKFYVSCVIIISHALGRGFVSGTGHTKDCYKMVHSPIFLTRRL